MYQQNVAGERQNVPGNVFQPAILRNIKQVTFCWTEKAALAVLARSYTGTSLGTARSIYLALAEVSSNTGNRPAVRAFVAELAKLSGYGGRTVQTYLRRFEELGLINITEHRQGYYSEANTYTILAVAPVVERAQAVAPVPSNWVERAKPVDSPALAAAGESGRTLSKKEIQKPKQQQTGVVVVLADTSPAAPRTTTATSGDVDEQTVKALTGLGVRRTVAEKMAATYPADDIIAWSRYAQRQASLKSKAGFVLTMLRAGERPPSPFGGMAGQRYQNTDSPTTTQQRRAGGLTEASPQEDSETVPAEPTSSPTQQSAICNPHSIIQNSKLKTQNREAANSALSTHHLALWQAVREDLRERLGNVTWATWLQHMRLLAVEEGRAVLSAPPVGNFAQRHAGEVGAVLCEMLGRTVAVEFVSGW